MARSLTILVAEAKRLGLRLDKRALERFERYLELLEAWHGQAGLTANVEPELVQRRHFGEALALLVTLREAKLLARGSPATIVDIGTGAGFPGLPLRIVEPTPELTLIESHGRRFRFLETVVEELALEGVSVVQARAEEAGRDPALREHFDVAVARAVAPLTVLVEYALPLLRPGGVLATPKGSRATRELREASAAIDALGGCAEDPRPLLLPEGAQQQLLLIVRRCGTLPRRYPRRPGIPHARPLR